MILEPGTFKTSAYRKAIPDWIKVATALMYAKLAGTPSDLDSAIELARSLQYDHRPPLNTRPYDTDAGDFVPPQNDPAHIEAIDSGKHLERTTGRKAGAERTVTTRGSDVGEAARIKEIQTSKAIHEAAMASKAGRYDEAARILASAPKQRRPKKKIPSRGFSQQQRPFPTNKKRSRA